MKRHAESTGTQEHAGHVIGSRTQQCRCDDDGGSEDA